MLRVGEREKIVGGEEILALRKRKRVFFKGGVGEIRLKVVWRICNA
jgi:hypothetical protein